MKTKILTIALAALTIGLLGSCKKDNGPETPKLPDGALAGEFSVSTNKKVKFSPGNLQATYTGSSYTWGFAANQYDFIGNAAGNITIDSQTNGAVVDLFGWSTEAASNNWGIHTDTESTTGYTDGNFKDWGTAIDSKGTWRTLSTAEWQYLFNTRTASTVNGTANARYAKATVNSKAGIILLPDTYTHPYGVTALSSINIEDAAFTANTYDSANWAKIESAGAVFLPVAGHRYGSHINLVGDGGYWSSSASDGDYAYFVYFNSDDVHPGNHERFRGFSVRLITLLANP